ncbi:zinc ribbon domain-containing protein [Thermanaerothrix sp. 4228-RoL]|uniref:Zinc ribbon domain-containing protein n=2 Tax=Thermanaerothrix TaxID=1077886 RepID=A0ABU3NQ61_9CHLR|nr:zinc ribbon domain-containing protein [Thermanaerothrix sp. 4228-RoL]MDT8898353.1 zinc ribbon domain-containing protein [Thermanaerothrix sp. 4228-RoL]
MPTYEYRCLDCRKRFEVFMTYAEYGTRAVTCLHCSSSNVQRRIGRVRVARSEESRLEDLADPSKLAGLEDDPKTLGRMMRQMSKEVGEDLGDVFDEVVSRLEAGQSPEDIEREIPELGSDEAGGDLGADDYDL